MNTQTYFNIVLFIDEKEKDFHFGVIEYKRLPEIWKLGEIYKTDGEYHIFVSIPIIDGLSKEIREHKKKQLEELIYKTKEKLIKHAENELHKQLTNLYSLYRLEIDRNE